MMILLFHPDSYYTLTKEYKPQEQPVTYKFPAKDSSLRHSYLPGKGNLCFNISFLKAKIISKQQQMIKRFGNINAARRDVSVFSSVAYRGTALVGKDLKDHKTMRLWHGWAGRDLKDCRTMESLGWVE